MARVYNFSPGPSRLPDEVMERARDEFCEYQNTGASLIELSHRGEHFLAVNERAQMLMREVLEIPDDYAVLFVPGGATGQADAVPLNLAAGRTSPCAYLVTGYWSKRAADEGAKYCKPVVVADTADTEYRTLPEQWHEPDDVAYLHYADNETVHGVEFPAPPKAKAPLVSDMSSSIATRKVNIRDYGVIYAGAQKNIGAAGVTVVIVRKDLIRPRAYAPRVWDYARQLKNDSMTNTPPTFQIYILALVMEWIKNKGGVAAMQKQSEQKAEIVYGALDAGFYRCHVCDAAARSRVNIPFFLPDESLLAEFLQGANDAGLIGLKGHIVLGGCRASLYNATTVAAAKALADYLCDFARRRG